MNCFMIYFKLYYYNMFGSSSVQQNLERLTNKYNNDIENTNNKLNNQQQLINELINNSTKQSNQIQQLIASNINKNNEIHELLHIINTKNNTTSALVKNHFEEINKLKTNITNISADICNSKKDALIFIGSISMIGFNSVCFPIFVSPTITWHNLCLLIRSTKEYHNEGNINLYFDSLIKLDIKCFNLTTLRNMAGGLYLWTNMDQLLDAISESYVDFDCSMSGSRQKINENVPKKALFSYGTTYGNKPTNFNTIIEMGLMHNITFTL